MRAFVLLVAVLLLPSAGFAQESAASDKPERQTIRLTEWVEYEVVDRARGDLIQDGPLVLGSEELRFVRIIKDERCPQDQKCSQHGPLVVELQLGNESIEVMAPGQTRLKNRLIALQDLTPFPVEQGSPVKAESLKVDVYMIKRLGPVARP